MLDLTLDVGALIQTPGIETRLPIFSPSSDGAGKLRRLHIIGIPRSITRVLDDINLTSLTTLVLDEMPDSFKSPMFDQVSVCQAIEDNKINQKPRGDPDILSLSWFSLLLTLNNVKSLVINESALSGSDEDFRLLACAFPKLKKLAVPCAHSSPGSTLACLFYLSRYCPNLSEIKIGLWSRIDSDLEIIKKLPLLICLRSLNSWTFSSLTCLFWKPTIQTQPKHQPGWPYTKSIWLSKPPGSMHFSISERCLKRTWRIWNLTIKFYTMQMYPRIPLSKFIFFQLVVHL